MIPVSETDMQPFNSQPLLQVKLEEEMGPICGDSVKEGEHLEARHFIKNRQFKQTDGRENEKILVIMAPSKKKKNSSS